MAEPRSIRQYAPTTQFHRVKRPHQYLEMWQIAPGKKLGEHVGGLNLWMGEQLFIVTGDGLVQFEALSTLVLPHILEA